MRHSRGLFGAFLGLLVGYAVTPATAADGQMTWGVHISLAPTWFDPAEAPGFITPFMLYSIRGALAEDLKRNPGLTLKPTTIPGTFWLLVTEELGFLGGPRVRPLARAVVDHPPAPGAHAASRRADLELDCRVALHPGGPDRAP